MKIIVNERELKEYFDGLARLLELRTAMSEAPNQQDGSTMLNELRQTIREELASIEYESQRDAGTYSLNKLKQVFEPYTGKPVELLTPAGTVEGTITKVGSDYLVVREQGGTSVMAPLEQLIAFHLTGKQVDK
ncbi:hypothetical protein DFQ01_108114 [Paenibacillus cellulosilyticus]|uniref:Uncharacterized protein n=1 Tax=Paenibacillus cellulosilyticus TaxID=375489 RepID=A0A2V2YU99_9BACL|nr:hypothetical protein [Paenibacillus cellulosilyticus]PWW02837.1 hypothetical protein DFQ01_108114 [Paenibacillus cellulosilyticus]QKS45755.1 hypothetical protein HUB94_15900 [Paenibacillus cellulosilyticus]